MSALRFVAVGHFTHDVVKDGYTPGGSALYASITAAQRGFHSVVSTSVAETYQGMGLVRQHGIELHNRSSQHTTTFENRYHNGVRTQKVLNIATPLHGPFPAGDVLFLCPVIDEVPLEEFVRPAQCRWVGAGLQGWLRQLDNDGTVQRKVPLCLESFSKCDVVFLSDADLGSEHHDVLNELVRYVPMVVLTKNQHGARVYSKNRVFHVHAYPTIEVEPTGAGDVFAAAFLVALAKSEDPLRAAVSATCAASIVIEGPGIAPLERLNELPARLERYAQKVPSPHEVC